MAKKVEVIRINNTNYMIMKKAKRNETIYFFLSNPNEPTDMMIRKRIKNGKNEFAPLDNEEEFNKACKVLFNK